MRKAESNLTFILRQHHVMKRSALRFSHCQYNISRRNTVVPYSFGFLTFTALKNKEKRVLHKFIFIYILFFPFFVVARNRG